MDRLLEEIINVAFNENATDIQLKPGYPPAQRYLDELIDMNDFPVITEERMESFIFQLSKDREIEKPIYEIRDYDFSYAWKGNRRLRINLHQSSEGSNLVIRLIPNKPYTFQELSLPADIEKIAQRRSGVIFVTGRNRQGKSTTINAIIHYINKSRKCHIITLEDPIEFIHEPIQARITQREIDEHTDSFERGLKACLRQSPDVIMVGEVRDRKTFLALMDAADTGVLVISTIHTDNTISTINRAISYAPQEEQMNICDRLSSSLTAVISQRLVKKIGGGAIPIIEILERNPSISEFIRKNSINQLNLKDDRGKYYKPFDDYIIKLVKERLISVETSIYSAYSPDEVRAALTREGIPIPD